MPERPIGQEATDELTRAFRRGQADGRILGPLSEANVARAKRWHPGFPDEQDWTLGDWGNAMAGEAGEACNVIKKIRRVETDKQRRDTEGDIIALCDKLAGELADVIIYVDLIAAQCGIDLDHEVRLKFNEVSDQYGFPEKI